MSVTSMVSNAVVATETPSAQVNVRTPWRTSAEIGVLVVAATGLFAVTLTGAEPSWRFALSGLILFAAWSWSRGRSQDESSFSSLVQPFATLGAALWAFSFFRLFGWGFWPVQHPGGVEEYLALFYMQFVLTATIGAAALWALPRRPNHTLHWGRITDSGVAWVLIAGTGIIWATAISVVATGEPVLMVPILLLTPIACGKAMLLAFTEEIAYRGVVLSAAARRWGASSAILFQAVIFATFHAYLTPALLPRIPFIGAVFLLGLAFGWVAWRTKGIGWTWLCHSALALIVEWRNIS